MILSIGEILFDMFPRGRRLGGAAFNFAFHIHRLDGPVRFLSRIGDDPEGRAIRNFLEAQRFPAADLQLDRHKPTGRVTVALDEAGGPSFDILPGVAYDDITTTASIERFVAQDCRLIYFGSLVQRTANGARTVRRILGRRRPRTKCLFDVNLRPGCFHADILEDALHETDVLKLNEDELATLARMNAMGGGTEDKVAALRQRFAIELVALTRGERGSSLFSDHGRHDFQPSGAVAVKDTVGAGDAFAAMLAIGYLRAWPAERMLTAANRLAAAICGVQGAVPADPAFYDGLREALTLEKGDHG